MKREVFNYSRTDKDERLGRKVTCVSKFKATQKFYEQLQHERRPGSQYQILEETREWVDVDAIVREKFHPELLHQ